MEKSMWNVVIFKVEGGLLVSALVPTDDLDKNVVGAEYWVSIVIDGNVYDAKIIYSNYGKPMYYGVDVYCYNSDDIKEYSCKVEKIIEVEL